MKWIRKILKGMSLTAALFVFQACYGTPQDYYSTAVRVRVVSGETGEPVAGACVRSVKCADETVDGSEVWRSDYTDEQGELLLWTTEGLERLRVVDGDSLYAVVDTVVDPMETDSIDIVLVR